MKKKFISLCLAVAMLFSLASPVFALDTASNTEQLDTTIETVVPVAPKTTTDDASSTEPAISQDEESAPPKPAEVEILTDDFSYQPWLDEDGNDMLAGDGPVTDETYSPRPGMTRAAATDRNLGGTTLSGTQSSFTSTSTCTITLNSVTIDKSSSTSGEYPAIYVQSGTLTLNINGTCKLRAGGIAAGIQVANGASVVINMNTNATLEVFGGTDQYRAGAGIGSAAQATSSPGNITINSASGSTLCAHGGNRPYYGAAGIGTGAQAADFTRNITINAMSSGSSGTVQAAGSFGSHVSGAGIGGGCDSVAPTGSGRITISGASVNAYATGQITWNSSDSKWWHSNMTEGGSTSNGSAGIGSGGKNTSNGVNTAHGTASNIYINGTANVRACGSCEGAGIGGGAGDHASNIQISGSVTVSADSAGFGAGIGGGGYSDGTSIQISGTANVTANGSSYGAGIGGGWYGNGQNITIQGSNTSSRPTVTARGGSYGAGIGGGYCGGGFNIVINHAFLYGYSYHGAYIGSGYDYDPLSSNCHGPTVSLTNTEGITDTAHVLTNIKIDNSEIGSSNNRVVAYYSGSVIGTGGSNNGSSSTQFYTNALISNTSIYADKSMNQWTYGAGIGLGDSNSYVTDYIKIANCPAIDITAYYHGGGIGTGNGSYNHITANISNSDNLNIGYQINGFGIGMSNVTSGSFTANISNIERLSVKHSNTVNSSYPYDIGIGARNCSSTPVVINVSNCKSVDVQAYDGAAIGSAAGNNSKCTLTFTDCDNIVARSTGHGAAIGVGFGATSCNTEIQFLRCPTIQASTTGPDGTSAGTAVGVAGSSAQNKLTVTATDVESFTASGEANYSTAIGTGSSAYDNELHINIQPKSGVTSTLTAGTQDYGVAIGTGYSNYDNKQAGLTPTLTDIDIGPFSSVAINNSGNDSVGIGVGRSTYSTNGQNVTTDIDISNTGKITMSNVGIGIGLGGDVHGGVDTNIDINHANGIDITSSYTGIGMRDACYNVHDTNINLANCGNISVTAPYVGIGSGYQSYGSCGTSIVISDATSVSSTVTDSTYGTAIGSGYNNYQNSGSSPNLEVKLLRSGNITAKSQGYGVAIGAGREGNGEKVNILIDGCGAVVANGNSNSSTGSYGSGMGVGYNYQGTGIVNPVNIQVKNCASLTAAGSRYGAGIGTAGSANGDIALNITVTGTPTVTASARNDAAGIGTGYNNTNAGSKGTISINGATVTSNSTGAAGIGSGNNCRNGRLTLNLTNDTLRTGSTNGPALGLGKKNESSMTVNANLTNCTGTFNGTGYSAGIGQGLNNSQSVMNLTVSGGNITATGSKGGAGIGTGPVNAVCTFVLDAKNGAIINATGSTSLEDELSVVGSTGNTILDNLAAGRVMGSGAGIGGSEGTQVISITANGAQLTSRGTGDGNYGSAGIGGGSNGNGGEITLTNTTTKAYASDRGAGIGGGSRAVGGDITISGGNTLVYGGKYDCAGIGGGNNAAEHGTLTLSNNPTVTVYGCPNYSLAVPGEVTTNGVKFLQATLMEVPTTDTTFHVKDAGERDVITITQPADYGAFSTTLSNTLGNGTDYEVYMDTVKNGNPITYKMATPYTVEEFPVVNTESYAAELLTIIDFYTVKFDTNGGSSVADQTVRINNMVELPDENPTKAGYKFAGWYSNPELTDIYDFSSIVTSDMTLYARWIDADKAVYCVQHWRQTLDNTYILSSEQYLEGFVGETVSAEAIPAEGFSPINTDGTKLSGVLPAIGTLKLALYYNRDMVTIEFKNVDSLVGQPEGVTKISAMYGSTIVLPRAEKSGWVFDYYTKETEEGEQVTLLPNRIETFGNTLYANWTLKEGVKYTVCHYHQQLDGTYTEVLKEYFAAPKVNATVTAERPDYPGFHVNTYITDGTGTGKASESGDTILRVYYDRNEITVDLIDGYGLPNDFVKRTSGEAANIPTPSRVGYRFDGWFKADGTKLPDTARIDDCGNELTAHWTAVPTTAYSVRYYLQTPGGAYKVDQIDDLQGETDSTVNAQILVYDGYTLNTTKSKTSGVVAGDGSLVLSVFYDTKSYNVSFDTNGGNSIAGQNSIPYGGLVTRPSDPVKQGYDFVGWYTDSGCNIPFSFAETVKGNMTLYAKWLAKGDTVYKVQYWFETTGDYEMRDEITLSGATGARVEANVKYFPGYQESLTAADRLTSGMIAADGSLVLKVYYAYQTVTVEFDSNGGTEIAKQTVKINDYAERPAVPVKEGYTFEGWYSNAGLTRVFDFDATPVTKDMTLYAKWTAKADTSYTVKHYFEDSAVPGLYLELESISKVGTTGETAEAGLLDRAGFHENRTHPDRHEVGTILADGSLVLKLFYDRDIYHVDFVTNCESNIASQNVRFEDKATEPPAPVKDGADFAGWFIDPACVDAYDFDAKVIGDITLYAKWNAWNSVEYLTEYYLETLDGGYSLMDTVTNSAAAGDTVQAVINNYPGFVENKLHSDRVISGSLDRNSALTLKVYYNRLMMQVRYEANGADDIPDKSVKYGAKAENITPTRVGYDFNGWFTNASLTKPYDFDTPVTDTTILYAKWTAQGDTLYKVQYYTEAETGYELHHEVEKTSATGETVFADIIEITGFAHITGVDGEKLVGVVDENGTLVLKVYYKAVSHEVRFEVNGGSDVDPMTVEHNGKISAPVTVREGYTFAGWFTNASLTKAFDFNSEIKRDITLYAKWNSNGATNYTIQYFFEALDGSYDSKTDTKAAATGDLVEAIPIEFEGFTYDAGNEGNKLVGTVEADGSLLLSIYYTRNVYTVSFDANGGNAVESQTVMYQDTAVEPNAPEKEGYVFVCWLDSNSNRFDFDTPITDNTILFAQWNNADNIGYIVRHYFQNTDRTGYVLDNGATQYLTGKVGTEVTAETGIFYGFAENTEHENRVVSGEVAPDGSLILKLYYDRVEFTVDFESNGGSAVDSETAFYETPINEPNPPEKVGYVFDGWFVDSVFTSEFDFETEITEDMTLYAKWTPSDGVIYTVEFYQQTIDGENYVKVSDMALSGTTGERVEFGVTDIPVGFELNTDIPDAVMSGIVEADGSLVLKVYFDRLSYTLTLEPDNGENAITKTVCFGAELGELANVEKPGFSFENWISESGKAWFADDTMPASDLFLTAKWRESAMTKYTTEYYHEQLDGSYALVESVELTGLTNGVVSAHNAVFTGFTENTTHPDRKTQGVVEADGTLVLKVYYDRIRYIVSFESNEGEPVEDQTIPYGGVATAYAPNRTGYDFVGWHSDSSLTRLYNFSTEVKKDIVLYAKWAAHGDTRYTVQYFLQSAEDPTAYILDNTVTEYAPSGSTVHARVIEYLGFHENGAHPNSNVLGVVAADGSLLLSIYYDRNDVVVTFDVNGADVMQPMRVPFNSTIGNTVATWTGYVFEGWYIDKDLRVIFDPATPITVDMTLYAKWSPAKDTKYTVNHYQMDKGTKEYVLVDTEILTGTTGETVTATPKSYKGFSLTNYKDTKRTGIIAPDGSLVLSLYYNEYTPSFGGGGGGGSNKTDKEPVIILPRLIPGLLNLDQHISYVSGRPDGCFAPDDDITRGEVAMIVYRLMTDEAKAKYSASSNTFSDVPSSHWAFTAISTIANAGIVKGFENGTFGPDTPITRAELTAILTRFYETEDYNGRDLFSDIAGHWANVEINKGSDLGFIKGYIDGTFRPNQNITRAETVAMFNRILSRKASKETVLTDYRDFSDIFESAWYYWDIIEAANGHKHELSKTGDEIWISLTA